MLYTAIIFIKIADSHSIKTSIVQKKKKNFWLHTFLENLSLNDSFSYCFCSLKKEEEKRILILYYLSVTGYESDMLYNSQGRLFSNEQMKKKLFLILNETHMIFLAKWIFSGIFSKVTKFYLEAETLIITLMSWSSRNPGDSSELKSHFSI